MTLFVLNNKRKTESSVRHSVSETLVWLTSNKFRNKIYAQSYKCCRYVKKKRVQMKLATPHRKYNGALLTMSMSNLVEECRKEIGRLTKLELDRYTLTMLAMTITIKFWACPPSLRVLTFSSVIVRFTVSGFSAICCSPSPLFVPKSLLVSYTLLWCYLSIISSLYIGVATRHISRQTLSSRTFSYS